MKVGAVPRFRCGPFFWDIKAVARLTLANLAVNLPSEFT